MRMASSVGSAGWEVARSGTEVAAFLVDGFLAGAVLFFFGGVAAFFFDSGALILPLGGEAESSVGLFSTGFFGFLATILFPF